MRIRAVESGRRGRVSAPIHRRRMMNQRCGDRNCRRSPSRPSTPWAAGVDIWYEEKESLSTAPHRFYRFYHMRGDEQTVMWRHWRRTLDVFWDTPFIYYPVRYDLSWHEYPDTVKVVATWPLGEQRELLVTDGAPPGRDRIADRAASGADHSVRRTGFSRDRRPAGPRLPRPSNNSGHLMRRLKIPCTLEAVRTAFQFAHAAATPQQIRAAVRDGHVLTETIAQIKEIGNQDSFFAYWFDPANPGHYLAEARNVRWAGRFPGASMISAEFRLYARPGLAPPEMQVLARRRSKNRLRQGRNSRIGRLPTSCLPNRLLPKWGSGTG